MDMTSETVVECYSGHTYAQEPRAFWLDNQRRSVTVVRGRWREPTGPCFDVLADDGHAYVLAYNDTTDCWYVLAKASDRGFSSPAKNAGWSTECSDLRQITMHKEDGQ
jgi:hypothetical protein